MRAMLRRERRRRNLLAFQSNPPPFPHNVLIEHGDLPAPGVRTPELRVVITGDRFLAEGILQSPAPLCYYSIYSDVEEAFSALKVESYVGVIIDLNGWSIPTMALIDRVRILRQQRPELQIAFLTSEKESGMLSFLQASCRAIVINKRQKLAKVRALMQSTSSSYSVQEYVFSHKQWKILLLMAQGYSLRAIAQQQNLPYHRITYRTGSILALLRLSCRQQLVRLLQRISDKTRF